MLLKHACHPLYACSFYPILSMPGSEYAGKGKTESTAADDGNHSRMDFRNFASEMQFAGIAAAEEVHNLVDGVDKKNNNIAYSPRAE